MPLYTIEAHGVPRLVLAAGIVPTPPADLAGDPRIAHAMAEAERMGARIAAEAEKIHGFSPEEWSRLLDVREIEEEFDAWIGDELILRGGWDENRENIHIRPATDAEKAAWQEMAASEICEGYPADLEHEQILWLDERKFQPRKSRSMGG
jgi:hypothetical protein